MLHLKTQVIFLFADQQKDQDMLQFLSRVSRTLPAHPSGVRATEVMHNVGREGNISQVLVRPNILGGKLHQGLQR